MSETREAAVIRRFVEAFRPLSINAAIPSYVAGNIPQMLRADRARLNERNQAKAKLVNSFGMLPWGTPLVK